MILTTGVVRSLAGLPATGERILIEVATEARYRPIFQGLSGIERLWTREEIEEAARGRAASSAL